MTDSDDRGWRTLGNGGDLAVGDKREFPHPDGGHVLVIRTVQGLHACAADCPHQDTPLAEGILHGTVLTCPLHLWQWDITTGEPLGIAELPLPLFDVREEDGAIIIRARTI